MENPYEYAMATEFVVPKQETDILTDGPITGYQDATGFCHEGFEDTE